MDNRYFEHVARRVALRQTISSMLRKAPVFLIAIIACILLYQLDAAKSNYVTKTTAPIEINDDFMKSAQDIIAPENTQEPKTPDEKAEKKKQWDAVKPELERVKRQKFGDNALLIESLRERVRAEYASQLKIYQDQLDSFVKERDEQLTALLRQRFALENVRESIKNRGLAALTDYNKEAGIKERLPRNVDEAVKAKDQQLLALENREKFIKANYQKLEADNKQKVADLEQSAESRMNNIDSFFAPKLDEIHKPYTIVRNQPINRFLESTLNEQSGVYVIYEIFRMACILILILSLVFVLAMALRALPYQGEELLLERATGLLDGRSSPLKDVAKSTLLSVTALGIGSAAVVAGVSINDKANRALEAVEPRPAVSFPMNAPSDSMSYRMMVKNTNLINNKLEPEPFPTPMINLYPSVAPTPIVNVEPQPPIIRIVPVTSAGLTNNLRRISASVGNLNTRVDYLSTEVGTMGDKIHGKFAPSLTQIAETLGTINTNFNTFSKDATQQQTKQNENLTKATERLEGIDNHITELRQDNLNLQKTEGKNLATRATQFFGGERFMVSNQSYQALSNLIKKADRADKAKNVYQPILDALQAMIGEPPRDKGDFLKELRDNAAIQKDPSMKKYLQQWQSIILRYTRVSS